MRDFIRFFIAEAAENLPIREPIVEIGSRAAEGQEEIAELRPLFAGKAYIGCDIQEGPGVDRVEDVHNLSFTDDSVGTIISLDTLEHVANPIRALHEIHRVLAPGGIAVISSVMFFVIHEHPWDYWRFTPEGFELLLEPFEQRLVLAQGHPLIPVTVLGVGIKGPTPTLTRDLLPRTAAVCDDWENQGPIELGPFRFTTKGLWQLTLRETGKVLKHRLARRRA